jgi:hypothetical protein
MLPYGLVKVADYYKGEGKCSTFGDAADVESGQDNGVGSTGFRTVDHPTSAYMSLPIPIWNALNLRGFERVTVQFNGKQVRGFLADKGPSERLSRIVDCSPEVLRLLGANTDDVVTVIIRPTETVPAQERIAAAKLG